MDGGIYIQQQHSMCIKGTNQLEEMLHLKFKVQLMILEFNSSHFDISKCGASEEL